MNNKLDEVITLTDFDKLSLARRSREKEEDEGYEPIHPITPMSYNQRTYSNKRYFIKLRLKGVS